MADLDYWLCLLSCGFLALPWHSVLFGLLHSAPFLVWWVLFATCFKVVNDLLRLSLFWLIGVHLSRWSFPLLGVSQPSLTMLDNLGFALPICLGPSGHSVIFSGLFGIGVTIYPAVRYPSHDIFSGSFIKHSFGYIVYSFLNF